MGAPVTVNVYDLHDNSWIYWCGIGMICFNGPSTKTLGTWSLGNLLRTCLRASVSVK